MCRATESFRMIALVSFVYYLFVSDNSGHSSNATLMPPRHFRER